MNDDDGMPEFFIGSPEELQQHVQEMMTRTSMVQTDLKHRVQRLFDEMSEEHLTTLRYLLHTMAANPGAAYFYEGVASATLHIKHNVCPGCGVDHDKEALEAMEREANGDQPDEQPTRTVEESQADHPSQTPVPASEPSRDDLLAKYNLVDEEDGLFCAACRKQYVSLEDRMLDKPGPEGCEGCVNKAKWG